MTDIETRYIGDPWSLRAQLIDEAGAPLPIDPGAAVQAVAVDRYGNPIVPEITALASDADADWPNGWVAAHWPAADTTAVNTSVDRAWLIIRLDAVTIPADTPFPIARSVF